jgi:hypothetical protein
MKERKMASEKKVERLVKANAFNKHRRRTDLIQKEISSVHFRDVKFGTLSVSIFLSLCLFFTHTHTHTHIHTHR